MRRPSRIALPIILAVACGSGPDDPREGEIMAVLAAADQSMIVTRPLLVAGKYVRMIDAPIDFYRGTLPVFAHDWTKGGSLLSPSRFAVETPLVTSIGDPHPENFGTLRATDDTPALEPNDFDSADRAQYLWDLRRLVSGMALIAHAANTDDPKAAAVTGASARAIALATAAAYAARIADRAAGKAPVRIADPGTNAIMVDLFSRSARDHVARAELTSLTMRTGPVRKLKRGVLDPTDPSNTYADIPANAYAALPAALEMYRQTLLSPPPAAYFTLLDAAREFGSGVASWAKVRIILLVRGPTDDPSDDVVLEMKELTESTTAGTLPPGVFYDDVGTRVRTTSRTAWARPDAEPLWGTTHALGFDWQIKSETEGNKTLRTSRMNGDLGTVGALTELGQILGGLLARVHASDATALSAVAAAIAVDPVGFADEQADIGAAYALQSLADLPRFQRALAAYGPSLGVPVDPANRPSPDLQALYGTPPSP